MNDFDEMMMALNANLQDVLQKLDKFTSEEESLKDALDKLSSNMKDKLDAKAEESLKKYLGELRTFIIFTNFLRIKFYVCFS